MVVDDTASMSMHFARLNNDAVHQITAMLPVSSLLTLTAVSHELGRTFCPAVLTLAVSKMSLRAASLQPALKGLARRFPMLTDLDLSYSDATDDDVRLVADSFPSLTRLSLERCDSISDASLEVLARALPNLLALKLLGCRDVSDVGVRLLVPRCCSLRELHVGWCDISDSSLQVLAQLSRCLTLIDVSGCARVSDHGVRRLVAACPHLSSMHLEGCRELSGWAVAGASPHLEHLSLGGCTLLTDAGVGAIARSCGHLRTLCVRQCRAVSDAALALLAVHCTHLQSLDVSR